MSTWYPHAVRKPIVRNFGGKRRSTRAAIAHVDAGGAASLQGWFNNPASGASSHFYVKYDGTVEQYVDADLIAWTQRAANATAIGIETQGLGSGTWTPAQAAALAALIRWLCDHYGIPKVDMGSSRPGARGIGMHRYGIDPYRASGGEIWGPRGKACPGNDRVAQFPQVVAAVAGGGIGGGVIAPAPAPGLTEAQRIAQMNAGYSVAWIAAIQTKLNRLGHKLDPDGVRGAKTIAAVVAFQKQHGLVPDGLPGVATNDKLDEVLRAPSGKDVAQIIAMQRAVRAAPDGVWGPDSRKRLDTLRAATSHHGYRFPNGKAYAQQVVGARDDGIWGANSRKAHDATVASVQRALKVADDGIWGQNTEDAYNTFLRNAS